MTTRLPHLSTLFFLLAGAFSCTAAELFVDCAAGTAAGPGTAAAPFQTIQQAVDAAAAGDTVTVLPGVYDQGTASFTASGVTSANRVLIGKNLTLRSRDGAAATHIVGAKDPAATANFGMGPDAVRCIAVRGDLSAVTGVTIQGFTIRNGATQYGSDTIPVRGGGILNYQAQPAIANIEKIRVVDCVVQDCVGTRGGAAYGIAAIRCRFLRNQASSYGAAMRQCNAYNCLFVENGSTGNATSTGVLAYGHRIVNCTIANNRGTSAIAQFNTQANATVSNCVIVSNGSLHNNGEAKIWTSVTDYNYSSNGNAQVTYAMTENPQFLAPALGDYRLLAGAQSVENNPARVEALAGLAEDTACTDLLGNPRVTDGKVLAGCYQNAVTPAGGKTLVYAATGGSMFLDGYPVLRDTYFYPDDWPKTYAVTYTADSGKSLVYYACQGRVRWPTMDERFHYLPPKDPSRSVSFTATFGPVIHVAPDADDAAADGTEARPYSLQAGVAAATVPSLVLAKPGVYANGQMRASAGWHPSRVELVSTAVPVRLKSREGAANTVIRGRADPEPVIANDIGLGPNALRCVSLRGNNALQGFTLVDGHTSIAANDADDNSNYTVRGGGVVSYTPDAGVLDCVITNNFASRGAAFFAGMLERCRLVDNVITPKGNSTTRTGWIYSSVIADNAMTQNAVVGQETRAINCTVARNRTVENASILASVAYATNSVFALNTSCAYDTVSSVIAYSVYEVGNLGLGCARETTRFADADAGDWRLCATDAAVYRGIPDVWEGRNVVDFYGVPFSFNAEGRMHAGAVETLVPEILVASNLPGAMTDRLGTAKVGPEGLTVTATQAGRRLVGFALNGVTQAVAGASITITPEQAQALAPLTVMLVYQTDWFVDAVHGSDANDGWTEATAKKTLAGTLALAATGDTVTALPGDYAEGTMIESAETAHWTGSGSSAPAPTIRARAVLTNGVSLVSRDGADVTFITGADATEGGDAYGRGPDAVRCVYMGPKCTLRGFTVRNGRTGQEYRIGSSNIEYTDSHGAGVLSASDNSCWIENCVFTNNVAIRGGAARWGNFRNCSFFGNRSSATCPTVRDGNVFSCFVGRNYGSHTVYSVKVENTTILRQSDSGEVVVAYGTGGGNATLVNCLLEKGYAQAIPSVYNCAFATGTQILTDKAVVMELPADSGCVFGETQLDAQGRPVLGHNVAIDAGDPGLTTDPVSLEKDIGGGQRVYNGRLDAGCYECDWRPLYAADLCLSRFSVTNATPNVHETADKGVALPADERVDALWESGRLKGAYIVSAEVTGTGTLTMSVNGEVVETIAGPTDGVREFRYTSQTFPADVNAVSFSYAAGTGDTGRAILRSLVHSDGTIILFR